MIHRQIGRHLQTVQGLPKGLVWDSLAMRDECRKEINGHAGQVLCCCIVINMIVVAGASCSHEESVDLQPDRHDVTLHQVQVDCCD